jgi:hypothetical protein
MKACRGSRGIALLILNLGTDTFGVKQLGCEVNLSPLSSAEVKNE